MAALAIAVLVTASVDGRPSSARPAGDANAAARAFLARADTQRLPLHGASGLVAFNTDGDAWLVVHQLREAPRGRVYQIWIIDGQHASPAGTVNGGTATSSTKLTKRLSSRSHVIAVSLEPVGGSEQPRGLLQFATGPV